MQCSMSSLLNTTYIVMLRSYVKPIADELYIYFNKCGVWEL